jgi:RNA polymerase sigma-70 factor (ECF subfamily)
VVWREPLASLRTGMNPGEDVQADSATDAGARSAPAPKRSGASANRIDPEWEVLARAAAGESAAFGGLVERHQARVLQVCSRLLQDLEEARDAAQEVFLRLDRKAPRLRPQGKIFTLLDRIAVNHCLSRLRRKTLVRLLPLPEALRGRQAARGEIAALPPTQRVVLILAKLEGLTQHEIAEMLGMGVGAVESRLVRAMRTLERAQEVHESGVPPREEERVKRRDRLDLIRYLQGELSSWRGEEFRVRLRTDPALAGVHERWQEIWTRLERLDEGVGGQDPAELRSRVMERILAERQHRQESQGRIGAQTDAKLLAAP